MKRLYVMAAAVPLLALLAVAQDDAAAQKMKAMEQLQKVKAEFDAVASQMKVIGIAGR